MMLRFVFASLVTVAIASSDDFLASNSIDLAHSSGLALLSEEDYEQVASLSIDQAKGSKIAPRQHQSKQVLVGQASREIENKPSEAVLLQAGGVNESAELVLLRSQLATVTKDLADLAAKVAKAEPPKKQFDRKPFASHASRPNKLKNRSWTSEKTSDYYLIDMYFFWDNCPDGFYPYANGIVAGYYTYVCAYDATSWAWSCDWAEDPKAAILCGQYGGTLPSDW